MRTSGPGSVSSSQRSSSSAGPRCARCASTIRRASNPKAPGRPAAPAAEPALSHPSGSCPSELRGMSVLMRPRHLRWRGCIRAVTARRRAVVAPAAGAVPWAARVVASARARPGADGEDFGCAVATGREGRDDGVADTIGIGCVDERDRRSPESAADHPCPDRPGLHRRFDGGVEFGTRDLIVLGERSMRGQEELTDPPDPVARLTAGAFQMVDGGPDASVLVEHVPYPFPLLIGERTEVDCFVELTQTLDAEDPGGFLTAAPPVTVAAFAVGVGHPGVDDQQSQSLGVEVEG